MRWSNLAMLARLSSIVSVPDQELGIRVMRVLAELQPFYMLQGQTPAVGDGAGSSAANRRAPAVKGWSRSTVHE